MVGIRIDALIRVGSVFPGACCWGSGGDSVGDHGGGFSAVPTLSSIERTAHCGAFF